MKNSISAVNSFLADIPILYPLNTLENQRIPGAFSGKKIATLARNGLMIFERMVNTLVKSSHLKAT